MKDSIKVEIVQKDKRKSDFDEGAVGYVVGICQGYYGRPQVAVAMGRKIVIVPSEAVRIINDAEYDERKNA